MLAQKLGVRALEGEADDALLNDLFAMLGAVETDMTLFFRLLANVPVDARTADDAALRRTAARALTTPTTRSSRRTSREWRTGCAVTPNACDATARPTTSAARA